MIFTIIFWAILITTVAFFAREIAETLLLVVIFGVVFPLLWLVSLLDDSLNLYVKYRGKKWP